MVRRQKSYGPAACLMTSRAKGASWSATTQILRDGQVRNFPDN